MTNNIPTIILSGPHNAQIASVIFTDINFIYNKLKGYRTGVEFKTKPILFDPYVLGVWLGDGTSSKPEITNQDANILCHVRNLIKKYNSSSSNPHLAFFKAFKKYFCRRRIRKKTSCCIFCNNCPGWENLSG